MFHLHGAELRVVIFVCVALSVISSVLPTDTLSAKIKHFNFGEFPNGELYRSRCQSFTKWGQKLAGRGLGQEATRRRQQLELTLIGFVSNESNKITEN
jgi:hypothetical protein